MNLRLGTLLFILFAIETFAQDPNISVFEDVEIKSNYQKNDTVEHKVVLTGREGCEISNPCGPEDSPKKDV
jgi:hypothetical protein